MDSLAASLEAESCAKAEGLCIKKKLESDINELEIALDHSNKANAAAHKSIKHYQGQLSELSNSLRKKVVNNKKSLRRQAWLSAKES